MRKEDIDTLVLCKLYNSWHAWCDAGVRIQSPSGGSIWFPKEGYHTLCMDPSTTPAEAELMYRLVQGYFEFNFITLTIEEMKALVAIARKWPGAEQKLRYAQVTTPSLKPIGNSIVTINE